MYRVDTRELDGSIVRHQRNVKLGTVSELPTKAAAQEALARRIGQEPTVDITFSELVDRWRAAVAPTLKSTTSKSYLNVLRARSSHFREPKDFRDWEVRRGDFPC